MSDNFWKPNELGKYLRLLDDIESHRDDKIDLVRRRLRTGFYLSGEVARVTAVKILASSDARRLRF